MIKLQELTPEIYYKQSRDFQFIGRLYDIVLNYVKTNASNLSQLPIGDHMNERLLNLLALTLGLKTNKNYNTKQLLAICSVLPEILRKKGSVNALIVAVNALLSAEAIDQALDYVVESKTKITLYLSQQLSDLSLLRDLLDYILPAGMCCQMVRESQLLTIIEDKFTVADSIQVYKKSAAEISKLPIATTEQDKDENDYLSLENLSIGRIGDANSMLANITIIEEEEEENE